MHTTRVRSYSPQNKKSFSVKSLIYSGKGHSNSPSELKIGLNQCVRKRDRG